MTVHVIKAPAGLGKTTLIIDTLAKSPHKRVEIYVPTLDLAKEIHAKLAAQSVTSKTVVGREQPDDNNQTMCRKPALAREVSRLGYPVFPVLCMGQTTPGDVYSRKSCAHFRECGYLKQFGATERVMIFTHAYLPLPRNNQESLVPSLVVIDESFISTCLETYVLPWPEIVNAIQSGSRPNAKSVVDTLFKALQDGAPVLDALRQNGDIDNVMRLARKEVAASGAGFNPCNSDEEFLKKLRAQGALRLRLDVLFDVLTAELKTPRSQVHGVELDRTTQNLRVHYRKPITRFKFDNVAPDFLLIDANADVELIRPWFPDALFREIPATRKAYVIQCSSTRGATSAFVPEKNTNAGSREAAQRNLDGLQQLIDRECKDSKTRWLVVGPQAVTGNPAKGIAPLLTCPTNGSFAHFNGLRGVDAYKDFDGVIIIGRNQPAIAGLETLARALWHDSPEPLVFADDWEVAERPYRMRDPGLGIGVEVLVHPDTRIQRLHEQLREGESTQAIDRLRLIHAATPKRVIVVSNIPLEIEVDELKSFDQLARQSRFERAMEELKGVVPLNPEFLCARFRDLWATPAAAKKDIEREHQKGQIPNSISISNLSLSNYEYRVAGQSRRSRVLSIHPIHPTLVELSRHLGRPVVLRAMTGGTPGFEIFGAMGAATLQPISACGTGFQNDSIPVISDQPAHQKRSAA